MTVRDVAAFLDVDEKTISRLAQKRDISGFKVAGSSRFPRADVMKWIEERKLTAQSTEEQKLIRVMPSVNKGRAEK